MRHRWHILRAGGAGLAALVVMAIWQSAAAQATRSVPPMVRGADPTATQPATRNSSPATSNQQPATPPATSNQQPATAPATRNSQPPTTNHQPPTTHSLLADLRNDHWVRRDAAAAALIELGEEARPSLQRALDATLDPDLRTRLEAILWAIERSRFTRPTPITLDHRDAPASEVFDDLARQSGVRFLLPEQKLPRITLRANREPFWSVMLRLCPLAGVIPSPGPAPQAIQLEPGQWRARPAAVAGPLLILAGQAGRYSSIDLGQADAPERSLNLQLNVYADPGVRVLAYSPLPINLEARDQAGTIIETFSGEEIDLCPNGAGQPFSASLNVEFNHPQHRVRKLSRLAGTLLITVPRRIETVEVDLQAANASRNLQRFAFTGSKTSGDKTDVSLVLHRNGADREQWDNYLTGEVLGQCVRLLDAQGRGLLFRSMSEPRQQDPEHSSATITLSFIRPKDASGKYVAGPPTRMLFDVVSEFKTMSVPFELKDLVMP